jgi:glyoxylase-like metal-dependent hydrolase (beta-lactamase superfamily II)
MLVVWLPAEKVLFQSDMGNPPAPNQQLPPPSPSLTNYDETLRRLNIQPEKIAGGHGNRVMTPADQNRLMGRATTTN